MIQLEVEGEVPTESESDVNKKKSFVRSAKLRFGHAFVPVLGLAHFDSCEGINNQ